MTLSSEDKSILRTSAGDFPLDQYCLRETGREWKILHVSAVISKAAESDFILELAERLPYGVTLWASAIALAHDVASRADAFKAKRVLELGAGTGLPGIVAASFGAQVVQSDRNELVMSLGKRNLALNGIETIEQRLVDWTNWNETGQYHWILGSDILYGEEMHPHLQQIFESNLAPGGRILIADPFRVTGLKLLERLEENGWSISMNKWSIGEESSPRQIGVFELALH